MIKDKRVFYLIPGGVTDPTHTAASTLAWLCSFLDSLPPGASFLLHHVPSIQLTDAKSTLPHVFCMPY